MDWIHLWEGATKRDTGLQYLESIRHGSQFTLPIGQSHGMSGECSPGETMRIVPSFRSLVFALVISMVVAATSFAQIA